MPRADLSNDLVHWIKGASNEDAFEILRRIVREQRLVGRGDLIKGGYPCICFTEAPEATFHQIIGKYRPFGIRVSKAWLFARGGRPVIYQPDDEFELLPEALRWRHMRYEPTRELPVDFSWEREWRIRTGELELPFGEVSLIVPHNSWARALQEEHENAEEERIEFEAIAYGDEWHAWQRPESFGYVYSVINV